MHITSSARLMLALHTTTKESLIDIWMNGNSCLTTNPYHSIVPFDDQYTDGTKQILSTESSRFLQYIHIHIDATDYWPMAREYSVWNAVIAALQFWTADLDAHTLSSAREEVSSVFFYTASAHTLCQQPDKILFSDFVSTLNAVFE